METKHLLIGTAAVLGGLLLFGKKDEDETPEVGACCGKGPRLPEVGFAPAEDPVELFDPTDVARWEAATPTMGHFFQAGRGSMLLGQGSKSITYTALHQAAYDVAIEAGVGESDARLFAKKVAGNANHRCEYANLILSSRWNDACYGTWGYSQKDYPGPHGRSIPLGSCHADNRARFEEGLEAERRVALCTPADKGTGKAVVSGMSRPFLWLPLANLDLILDGEITTRDMVWPGPSRISTIEPPPKFWRTSA